MMFALFLCAVNGGGFEVSIPLDEVPDESGGATIKGIAETGFPSPEHIPFMVVRNTTIGTGTPEMVVVLPRQCPDCNIGNTQTQDGVYIRAKAYICQKGVCRALDGSDTLNLTLVRFWLM